MWENIWTLEVVGWIQWTFKWKVVVSIDQKIYTLKLLYLSLVIYETVSMFIVIYNKYDIFK